MDSLSSGTLLARRYRLLDRVGVGGMSVIWRAHDEMLDRLVAVKVLASSLAADARFREWARAEARAAAALDHPASPRSTTTERRSTKTAPSPRTW